MEEDKLVCSEKCPHFNKINKVKEREPKADEYLNYQICLSYLQMKLD